MRTSYEVSYAVEPHALSGPQMFIKFLLSIIKWDIIESSSED